MKRYAYFTIRVRIGDSGPVDGIVERLGTGERRDFSSCDELKQRLGELLDDRNMRWLTRDDKEDPAGAALPRGETAR